MEEEYKRLLSTSNTVGNFYENVYSPVLQTLPWLDKEDGLKTASEKVLGNLAFLAYDLSAYKHQKVSKQTTERLRARGKELQSIYQKMQDELRPLRAMAPDGNGTWDKLQEMAVEWKELSHHNLLPHRMHHAVEYYFAQGAKDVGEPHISAGEAVLAKLIAKEVKFLIEKGESDHAIALVFGTEGHWMDRTFLNTLRSIRNDQMPFSYQKRRVTREKR